MDIAVIGAGAFGSEFAKAAVAAGHDVTITARHAENAERAAASSGAIAVANEHAVDGSRIVVLAIPGAAVSEWSQQFGARLGRAVVIDATNPLTSDFSDTFTSGRSAAEELQEKLPNAAVVKAFNTVFSSRLSDPVEGDSQLEVWVSGNDAAAKRAATDLARSLGFLCRDAGALRMARAQEELAFLHISLNAANGWVWRSAIQLVGPTTA